MQLRPEGRSRGQVIIVAALVIAAIFVGLALVLNSGIYAENLSSRETTDTEGALSFTLETNEAIAEAYERTNDANESSADDAEATFNETVDSWESAQQRRGALQGIGVGVERTAHVGWRLEQSEDRQFTDANSNDNWTVATGAEGVAEFKLDVKRDGLYEADNDWNNVNESFNVRVADGSNEWRLYIFQNTSTNSIVVHAGEPGVYGSIDNLPDDETCEQSGSRAVIDLQSKQLAGSNCDALNFSDDLDSSIEISYHNASLGAEQVNGTYSLVVNGSDAAETSNFNAPNDAAPTAQAVVYSASYASHYGRADLTFERRGTHAVREESYAS